MIHDYDQAVFLIGTCVEGSGINLNDTLNNPNFSPHPALDGLLGWFSKQGGTAEIRTMAVRAQHLYRAWRQSNKAKLVAQETFFFTDEE